MDNYHTAEDYYQRTEQDFFMSYVINPRKGVMQCIVISCKLRFWYNKKLDTYVMLSCITLK